MQDDKFYDLSLSQEAIYVDSHLYGETSKYNMGAAVHINGELDIDLFIKAMNITVNTADALRMKIEKQGEKAVQKFVARIDYSLPCFDYTSLDDPYKAALEKIIEHYKKDEGIYAFPLSTDMLFKVEKTTYIWYPKFHHIQNDAYGHSILTEKTALIYNRLLHNEPYDDIEFPPFKDIIEDDKQYVESSRYEQDEAYWSEKFARLPESLPFTILKRQRGITSIKTDSYVLAVNRLCYNTINRLADEASSTEYHILLAILFTYLHRAYGREDIVTGMPILNRSNRKFRDTVGMFMSMMPFRLTVKPNMTFLELLAEIKETTRKDYRHQRYPLGHLISKAREKHDSVGALFDVVMIFNKINYGMKFGSASLRTFTLDTENREESLTLMVEDMQDNQDVNISFAYNPEVISEGEAKQIALGFETILLDVIFNPEKQLQQLDIMKDDLRKTVIYDFNKTDSPLDEDLTIHRIFRKAAAAYPENIALKGEKRYTYRELDLVSEAVAGYLINEAKIKNGDIVAVMTGRNESIAIALLGVLKAGAVYMPVDISYPEDRIRYMLENSECGIILKSEPVNTTIPDTIASFDLGKAMIYKHDNIAIKTKGSSPAYVIYTSGSTGKPKGVLVQHTPFVNMALEQIRLLEVSHVDNVLQFASHSFDASLSEMAMALFSGAALNFCPKDVIEDISLFEKYLSEKEITVATLPPSYRRRMNSNAVRSLRALISAGEAADNQLAELYADNLICFNGYGPTEASVCAAMHRIRKSDAKYGIPIGKPLANMKIYILDSELLPAAPYVAGEIYIGGKSLAAGYVNNPELTKERFIDNPFIPGERIYRTGDIGRWCEDGTIEYIGRNDSQIKLRGYRVELEEIEQNITAIEGIEKAAVIHKNESLLAFFTPPGNIELSSLQLRLAGALPSYMIPSAFYPLDTMPELPNGKIDRKSLYDITVHALTAKTDNVQPRNKTEVLLQHIWEDVLDINGIGINDNFYKLGGHSLKAITLLSRIKTTFGTELSLAEMLKRPSIAEMAALISETQLVTDLPINPAPDMECYPLTHTQRRIWVLSQLKDGSTAYNMPGALRIKGELDIPALEKSFFFLINRHEALRTAIVLTDDKPVQTIVPEVNFKLEYSDISSHTDPENEAADLAAGYALLPFDFSKPPLMRAKVLRIAESEFVLLFSIHHLVSDGWSLSIVLRELTKAYNAIMKKEKVSFTEVNIHYKDYAVWQHSPEVISTLDKSREFWHTALSGELSRLDLPLDKPRPAVLSFNGGIVRQRIDAGLFNRLNDFAQQHNVSLFILLQTLLRTLLYRYTGTTDIILGTIVAARSHSQLENIIGFFANTLLLRGEVDPKMTLLDLLQQVKEETLQALEHQDYPFDLLIDELDLPRDTGRNPGFDVLLVHQNIDMKKEPLGSAIVSDFPFTRAASQFDLTFHFEESNDAFELLLEYNSDLFTEEKINRIGLHFQTIARNALDNTSAAISSLHYMNDLELKKALQTFPIGESKSFEQGNIINVVYTAAEKNPDTTALTDGTESYTYKDLITNVDKAAAVLSSNGIQKGDAVAVMTNRSVKTAVWLLAILKIGAVYVPLDPDQPDARLKYIIEECKASGIINNSKHVSLPAGISPIPIDAFTSHNGNATPAVTITDNEPAYILFTSGSTGSPKGVVAGHRSLHNLINHMQQEVYKKLEGEVRELMLVSFIFDVSLQQIFCTLTQGNTLYIADKETVYDPAKTIALLRNARITLFDASPTVLTSLIDERLFGHDDYSLQAITIGSEAVPGELISKLTNGFKRQNIKLFNFYGPTECTVNATGWQIDPGTISGRTIVPIGFPLSNSKAYIVDRDGNPCGIGIPGELLIAGECLAIGYLDEKLNEHSFITLPGLPESRLYATGDIAAWLPDGNIRFIGRKDNQIKIRGQRIELNEIQFAAQSLKGINKALPVLKGSGNNKYIALYYTAGNTLPEDAIKQHLTANLPAAMIPKCYCNVAEFPVLPSGKIDVNALPEPDECNQSTASDTTAFTETEKELLSIWQDILQHKNIARDDNFFDAGGNSLLLVKLQRAVDRSFPGVFSVTDLFSYTTIAAQAKRLTEESETTTTDTFFNGIEVEDDWFSDKQKDAHLFEAVLPLHIKEKLNIRNTSYSAAAVALGVYAYSLAQSAGSDWIEIVCIDDEGCRIIKLDLSLMDELDDLFKEVHLQLQNKPVNNIPQENTAGRLKAAFGIVDNLDTPISDDIYHTAVYITADFDKVISIASANCNEQKIKELLELYIEMLDAF